MRARQALAAAPLLSAVLAAAPAAAAAPAPAPVAHAEAKERLARAMDAALPSFPGLAGRAVILEPYEAADLYFRAWPYGWWKSRERRVYAVLYNLELLKDFPAQEALEGIVAHELAHLEYFAARSGWGLLWFGARYSASGRAEAEHERATDLLAVERGFGPRLLLYKRWVLARSDDKEKARRRRVYMTPEEIEAWIEARGGAKEPAVGARLLKISN